MSEPVHPNYRLQDLQRRWEREPSSRVYQQLAEEYRKADQLVEAAVVLEDGLGRRPSDIAGRVALGRCRLDLGQIPEAIEALENVLARDPAHHVGNKLLLDAYLHAGDLVQARERLEIYRLLNDRDPELQHLEFRLSQLASGAPPEPIPPTSPVIVEPLVTDAVDEDPAATDAIAGDSVPEDAVAEDAVAEDLASDVWTLQEAAEPSEDLEATDPSMHWEVEEPVADTDPGPQQEALSMASQSAESKANDVFDFGNVAPPADSFADLWAGLGVGATQPSEDAVLFEGAPAEAAATESLSTEEPVVAESVVTESVFEEPASEEPVVAEASSELFAMADRPVAKPAAEVDLWQQLAEEARSGKSPGLEKPQAEQPQANEPQLETSPIEQPTVPLPEKAYGAEFTDSPAIDPDRETSVLEVSPIDIPASELTDVGSDEVLDEVSMDAPTLPLPSTESRALEDDDAPGEEAFEAASEVDDEAAPTAGSEEDWAPEAYAGPYEAAAKARQQAQAMAESLQADVAEDEASEPVAATPVLEVEPLVAPPTVEAEAEVEIETPEAAPTVTMGTLYLKQGHHDEAARIFEGILAKDPENVAARAGHRLATRADGNELGAIDLMAAQALDGTLPEDLNDRKILVLSNYIQHLTARSKENHVH